MNAAAERRARPSAGNVFVIVGSVVLVALSIVAVVLFFRGGGDSSSIRHNAHQKPVSTTAMQVAVKIVDNDFEPAALTVKRGATITWQHNGTLPHDVTEDEGVFHSPYLTKGKEFEHTFDTQGTFYYHCSIHHIMTGSVTVTD